MTEAPESSRPEADRVRGWADGAVGAGRATELAELDDEAVSSRPA